MDDVPIEEIDAAMDRLLNIMGADKFIQLTWLIQEVVKKTGWGGVDIVIAEGRIATLKQEISHK
jgi:hypothetical protein